ncbi:MAG: lysophospholipid acyltransferase family protein [Desulfovermiculus sp.]|nr:lysophospholipid acyltransferase family protein [Desulfovermiculus sp.]
MGNSLLQSQYTYSCLTLAVRIWSKTLRYSRIGYDRLEQGSRKGPVIYALWHDELFPLCYLHRNQGVVAVVSSSKDGEMLAQVLSRLGFQLARGSSSRNGMQAVRQVLQTMNRTGANAVFTVDGPRGPRHEVKEGAVYLAAKSGLPLVPVRVHMHPVKRFHKAWDKFQLPLPGARCTVYYGLPYTLAREKINSHRLQCERDRLQGAMQTLKKNFKKPFMNRNKD